MLQVAGSNRIYLQAADRWGNNITRGGDLFVARWTERARAAADQDKATDQRLQEGTLAEGTSDTGLSAMGFPGSDSYNGPFSPASLLSPAERRRSSNNASFEKRYDGFGNESNNASVMDVGSGRYEISTTAAAGDRWLEIGVLEPGGLWGTYYADWGPGTPGTKPDREHNPLYDSSFWTLPFCLCNGRRVRGCHEIPREMGRKLHTKSVTANRSCQPQIAKRNADSMEVCTGAGGQLSTCRVVLICSASGTPT